MPIQKEISYARPLSGNRQTGTLKISWIRRMVSRITQEHRIVYVVGHERIDFIQLELLQGAKDEFEWRRLDEYLESQYYLEAGK